MFRRRGDVTENKGTHDLLGIAPVGRAVERVTDSIVSGAQALLAAGLSSRCRGIWTIAARQGKWLASAECTRDGSKGGANVRGCLDRASTRRVTKVDYGEP